MIVAKVKNVLASGKSLSLPVLLSQLPTTFAMAFSTRMDAVHQNALIGMLIGVSNFGAIALCFAVGNYLKLHSSTIGNHQSKLTLITWSASATSVALVMTAYNFIIGGDHYPFFVKFVMISIFSATSFCISAYIAERQVRYKKIFQALQADALKLESLERSAQADLIAEKQDLISSINAGIRPELVRIGEQLELAVSKGADTPTISSVLKSVDQVLNDDLRAFIQELQVVPTAYRAPDPPSNTFELPRLAWRRLPLAPVSSFNIALGITFLITIATVWATPTSHRVTSPAVIASFLPVFLLKIFIDRVSILRSVPSTVWVVMAMLIVFITRLAVGGDSIIATLSRYYSSKTTADSAYMVVTGLSCSVAVFVGSIYKYFNDAYKTSSSTLRELNIAIESQLAQIQRQRNTVRRDIARLMHGPVQGKIAAIRMKLHQKLEQPEQQSALIDATEANQIVELLALVANEVATLGAIDATDRPKDNFNAVLESLTGLWLGILSISFELSPEAVHLLDANAYLHACMKSACAEAVTNASRHALASEIHFSISMIDDDSKIKLTAQDNGATFAGAVQPGNGLHDIVADGGSWTLKPTATGNELQVEFQTGSKLDFLTHI
jgi:hypothetical protein